eukprot:6156449-Pyramimonas_sp.AAC.1
MADHAQWVYFGCGPGVFRVRVNCGSSVVQAWLRQCPPTNAAAWLSTCNARAWLKYRSSVVQAWFKRSSGVVPSRDATT